MGSIILAEAERYAIEDHAARIDGRLYSINTASGTRYGVQASELKRWLLKLGVGDSAIAAVLEIEPNETDAAGRPGRMRICLKRR